MHNLDRVLNTQQMFNETEFEGGPFGAEFEGQDETGADAEAEAEALAAQLLGVQSEDELEAFIGGLLKSAAKGIANFSKSPAGKVIGGALRQAAKVALPTVGGALGSLIPVPGVGTAIGTMAGKALSSALELEFETGTEGEDREFEVAKQVVRMAQEAARTAAQAPAGANPTAVATNAVKSALQAVQGGASPHGQSLSGRWVRRGRHIVLLGV